MSPPPDGVFVSTPRIVGWTERTYRLYYIANPVPETGGLDITGSNLIIVIALWSVISDELVWIKIHIWNLIYDRLIPILGA